MTETPDTPFDEIDIDLGTTDEVSDDVEINLDFFGSDDETNVDDIEIDLGVEFDETDDETASDDEDDDDVEADEALEKALEELREELRSKIGDWYVVHTYSGMENRVKQNIDSRVKTLNMEDFIFETVVPTEDAIEVRNGQRKQVTRNVLPGYVLVRMDMTEESGATVRHTPSVTGFVGHANSPVPLSLDEVEKMLTPATMAKVAAASSTPTTRTRKKVEVMDFVVGDSVMVHEGPFAGIHATITEINTHNQRLKANVEILGRETPVDLTFSQIRKV